MDKNTLCPRDGLNPSSPLIRIFLHERSWVSFRCSRGKGKVYSPSWHLGNIETYNGYYRPLYLCIRPTQEGVWKNIGIKWGFGTQFCGLGIYFTWVLKGSEPEKKHPSFLLMANSHKLRKDSKNVNFKIGSWGPKKLSQIFNMPIIKSVARKGQNTPKSDFRGPKIPPRGASSTWNM